MNTSVNRTEGASGTTQPPAKQPYAKPMLSNLGSLRDLTMTKNTSGANDGKNNRFTGRGSHCVSADRQT